MDFADARRVHRSNHPQSQRRREGLVTPVDKSGNRSYDDWEGVGTRQRLRNDCSMTFQLATRMTVVPMGTVIPVITLVLARVMTLLIKATIIWIERGLGWAKVKLLQDCHRCNSHSSI